MARSAKLLFKSQNTENYFIIRTHHLLVENPECTNTHISPESPAINTLLPPYNYISRFYPFPKTVQPQVQQRQIFNCPDRAELLKQPVPGVYPCPWHTTDHGQTIQDCLQIIPLQLSALQSCISPKMVKLSINPSSEYLYSLLDTQTRALEFTRLHLTQKSLFISTAVSLGPLPAAPARAPDTSQTWRVSRWGGKEKGDAHSKFPNPCIPDPSDFVAGGWFGRSLAQLCAGDLRSDPSLRAGRTLRSANTNTSLTPSLSLSPAPSNYTTPAIIGSPILLLESFLPTAAFILQHLCHRPCVNYYVSPQCQHAELFFLL